MPRLIPVAAVLVAAFPALLSAQHPADVRFMQGMIGHHAQALAMTALLPERTTRADMRLLAERIDVSQRDEIAMMRAWLERHGQPLPDSAASHAAMGHDTGHDMGHDMGHGMAHDSTHAAAMPGMLTPAQMAELAAARGPAFDARFLRYMIQHHEGALVMVKQLLAVPGAGQDSEVYRFASDVDTDQRAEIARMRAMLSSLPNPTHDHP